MIGFYYLDFDGHKCSPAPTNVPQTLILHSSGKGYDSV